MGEDLGSLHAFRYADKVARYVSAWYGVSPPLSVPLGTAWIFAALSCVPNGTPWGWGFGYPGTAYLATLSRT